MSLSPALAQPSPAYPMEFPMTEPRPKFAIELPTEERGIGDWESRELDRLNRKLARTDLKEKEREKLLAERAALERRPQERAHAAWLKQAKAETEALAEARGEAVVSDESGLTRILDHDPLASLSWLTNDQYNAGIALRGFYARRGEDLSSAEITGMPSGAHNHEQFVATRAERAFEIRKTHWVTTAILAGTFRNARGDLCVVHAHQRFKAEGVSPELAVSMICAICDRGMSLTSQGTGRAYDRNRKALALGLDVAHEVFKG